MAELRGGAQFRGWEVDRYLLSGILDAVRANTYTLAKANGGKPSKPEPTYRPEKARAKSNGFAAMARTVFVAAQKKE